MESLNERVSVVSLYDQVTGQSKPEKVVWRGRSYQIDQIGLHHRFRRGQILVHLFSVTSGQNYLRLRLETDSLEWFMESFMDQSSNGL